MSCVAIGSAEARRKVRHMVFQSKTPPEQLVLRDEVEAELVSRYLDEVGVPHRIVRTDVAVYPGVFELEYGWGYVETPDAYVDAAQQVILDVRTPANPTADDPAPDEGTSAAGVDAE